MANQNDHKTMRQFNISARSIDDFIALERLLRGRLAGYGQEGERVLRGERGEVDDGSGKSLRTRTFYADVSPEEADEALKVLDSYRGKHGDPTGDGYEDPGISVSGGETDFTTGVYQMMDTGNLKSIMDLVKSQGGEVSFEKGGANTGTLRWSLPSDLTVAGDRGRPVKAPASLRSRLREDEKKHLKKFQDLMRTATGKTVAKSDILQMSDSYRAKLKRDAASVEAQKEQADNPEALEAVLGQKLQSDRLRKRLKASALFKGSGYTPGQIAAGDFFDNDDVMDQIGSDVVGYPVAVQRGIKRARQRRADRDIEPEDYRRAAYASLDRANAAMREKQAWLEDHPDDPLAKRMREAEERRTPGTKAFEQAERGRLDRSSERRKAAVKWAKANRSDPAAKAILRGSRGGGLNRLLRGAGAAVKNTALMAISAAIASAVKFLSALPGVASDVHKISAKGNALDMTDSSLRGYRHMEQMAHMKDGTLAETFGALVHSMPDLSTGDSRMGEIVRRIAPVSSRDPNSQATAKTITFGVNGGDPGELWREYMNTAFRLAFMNVGHLGSKEDFGASLRNSLTVYDSVAPGMAVQGADLAAVLFNKLSDGERALVAQVAAGKDREINGKPVSGLDVYGALEALLGVDDSNWKPKDTATTVEWTAAEQTAQAWTDLNTTVGEIKTGILVQILGATEGIAVWLRDILKTIMGLPIFNNKFDAVLAAMDEEDYRKNLAAKESLELQLAGADASVAALGEPLGIRSEADRAAALADWKSGVGVPAQFQAAGMAGLYENFVLSLYDQEGIREKLQGISANISAYDTGKIPDPKNPGKMTDRPLGGISRPFGWSSEQMAVSAANQKARDAQPFVAEIAEVIRAKDDAGAKYDSEKLQELRSEGLKIAERIRAMEDPRGLWQGLVHEFGLWGPDIAAEKEKLRENEQAIWAELQYKGPVAARKAWERLGAAREALEAAKERMPEGHSVYFDDHGNVVRFEMVEEYEQAYADAFAYYKRLRNALQAAAQQGRESEDRTEAERLQDAYNLDISDQAHSITARVETDVRRRTDQIDRAVVKQSVAAIAAQAGAEAARSALRGELVVSGTIKAEERTYAIELTDRSTGKTTVVKDVPNEVERNVDLAFAWRNFLNQNLPASSGAAGGE
jgi:hypothetical protein